MSDFLYKSLCTFDWDPAKSLLRAVEAQILNRFEWSSPMLDIGTGDGTFARMCMSEYRVTGVDSDSKAVEKASAEPVYERMLHCDAAHLPLDDGSYASIIMNSFLEHVPREQHEAVMREACRVLLPNGRILVTCHNHRFGKADPVVTVSQRLRIPSLGHAWSRYRDRRLALHSLEPSAYWEGVFGRAGLEIEEMGTYFPIPSERAFFGWTEFQYIGIGPINIGAGIRVLSRTLSRLGLEIHRRAVATIFRPILRPVFVMGKEPGSCCYFLLTRSSRGLPS